MLLRSLAIRQFACVTVAVAAIAAPSVVQAQERVYTMDIPAQELGKALKAVASLTGQQVVFKGDVVRGKRSSRVSGTYTAADAISRLLQGSGLSVSRSPKGVFVIARTTVAQADPVKVSDTVSSMGEEPPSREIVVTGSRLPGETAQPVQTYGERAIAQSGQTTVSEFLGTVPSVTNSVGENGFQTFGGVTTVQLRGLPVGSTLVLLNGRRVGNTSLTLFQNVFDLNTIPLAAVSRIEIVPQGSSAVYGSDALAGVVNIITKKDLSGLSANLRYGHALGTSTVDGSVAAGARIGPLSISFVGSYQERSALLFSEREVTSDPVGARLNFCNPGNIAAVSGDLPGLNSPIAAVPANLTGTPTQQSYAATAGRVNRCNLFESASVLPRTRRLGAFANFSYDLGGEAEMFSELIYTRTQEDVGRNGQIFTGLVPASNAFNPFGMPVRVSYQFTDLGPQIVKADSRLFRALLGARGEIAADWHWEIAGWYERNDDSYRQTNQIDAAALAAALASGNPDTALNLLTAGKAGSPALLDSIFNETTFPSPRNSQLSLNGWLRGDIVRLPAGALSLLVGAEYVDQSLLTFDRHSEAVFTEARIPLLPGADGGDDGLVATAAARYDHYSDIGGSLSPQFGLQWRPTRSLLLRGTYGRSFKAPFLNFLYFQGIPRTLPTFDPQLGITYSVFYPRSAGGNPDLESERGESSSIGLVYAGPAIPGLRVSVDYWQARISNAIKILPTVALLQNESQFPGAVSRDPATGRITQILDLYYNFGRIRARGIDLDVSYNFDTSVGAFTPALSVARILNYSAALTPGAPATDRRSRANADGNWAPDWKGTASLAWRHDDWSARIAGRYVGPYLDYDGVNRIGDSVLMDANLRFDLTRTFHQDARPGRTYLEIGVVNAFDRLPQISTFSNSTLGYDPTQADIRGRFGYVRLGFGF